MEGKNWGNFGSINTNEKIDAMNFSLDGEKHLGK